MHCMNINKFKILLLFLLLANLLPAQVSEYEYKAAFIERFTRFIDWPGEFNTIDTFIIAVIGKNPFNNSLDDLFAFTKIKNKNVEIIYTNSINDVTNINLVFISGSEKKRIKEILAAIGDKPILIISDSKGFAERGVHINMYVDENKIRYEMNPETLEKSGLRVTSLLLSSAKIVKTDD